MKDGNDVAKHIVIMKYLLAITIVLCVSILAVKFNNINLLWWYLILLWLF